MGKRGGCCCCCFHLRELCGLWRVKKEFFGEFIVFRHLSMDFTIFFSKLSLSFKHNGEIKKIAGGGGALPI